MKKLAGALSEVTALQFFGGTQGISLDEGILTVEVPEDKDGDLLKQQFDYFIRKAVEESAGTEHIAKIIFQRPPRQEVPAETPAHPQGGITPEGEANSSLLKKFTFDTFVQGPNNRYPVAMAQYVARHPGDESDHTNPLFMYGPTGVGKTHLLHAIGNMAIEEAAKENKKLNILYTTTENLMNEYVLQWTSDERKEAFRKKFRTPDILLVDDIQYMSGKQGLQEEFFNIFNALKDARRQIVMTSDRAPKEIPDLVDRLVSRFEGGLSLDVDMPAYETRVNILNMKLRGYPGISLRKDIIDFIAQKVTSSVRALEGALSCTVNYARLFPNPEKTITVDVLEKSILKNFIQQEESIVKLTCQDIQRAVCTHFGLTKEELLGKDRSQRIAVPRQLAIFLCRKLTETSSTDLGRAFNRNHSTILYSSTTVQNLINNNDSVVIPAAKAITSMLGRSMSDLN